VGRIVKIRPHPYGDRIWLADVEIGRGYQPQIVWGGVPLLDEGDLVPVAPPGSRLPQGKMRRRRYRGEVSEGMLCSLAELGWDLSVSDRVALLDERSGLTPGESLDSRESDWPSIISRSSGRITCVPGVQLTGARLLERSALLLDVEEALVDEFVDAERA
jgi:tRNA-binding EMAP/Myf-like protein